MKRIVIISDCTDVAFSEIRATIISIIPPNQQQEISIEPLVRVKEFSIINASFLIRLMAECYNPKNTIFLIVVNPLKTTRKKRARIMGETDNGFKFVGENTGVLSWLIDDFGLKNLYEFNKNNLSGREFISFGGKHFYAPMAAKVASGISMDKLGVKKKKSFLNKFKIPDGTVVHIDNFNSAKIKSNIPNSFNEGDKIKIKLSKNKNIIARFSFSMKDLPDNTWSIFPGSSLKNLPEIAKVRSLDGLNKFGVEIGDIVEFKKI